MLLRCQLARKKHHVINANVNNVNPTPEDVLKTGHSAPKRERMKGKQAESAPTPGLPAQAFCVYCWRASQWEVASSLGSSAA